MGGQFLMLLISFVSRNVFIQILGIRYLGLSSLFTNILSVLSLAELGIGNAIIYSLYKPLNDKNTEKVAALMSFYKKCYLFIGSAIIIIGLFLTPFIKYLAKDYSGIDNVYLIFILFVFNTGISYFFSYKQSLLVADQKQFKATINHYSYSLAMNIMQIIILLNTSNYILFLICQSFFIILENLTISYITNKSYPFLKNRSVKRIDSNDLRIIKKNTTAMVFHKIGGIIVYGTDNIIISVFLGLSSAGLYSNYKLITTSLSVIVKQFFLSLTASIGDLGAENNKKRVEEVYQIVLFINHFIYGFCSVCFFFLIKAFMSLWLGSGYALSDWVGIAFAIEFYFSGTRAPNTTFKEALGYFWNDRYKPIIESILNLILSVFFVTQYGITGVLIGTVLSNILTSYWIEPYVLYKNQFNKHLSSYFKTISVYFFANIII
ncbi:MAG: hypothetical protein RR623_08760, partial [Bacilli bacterium]